MAHDDGTKKELEAWLERHARELGLPAVPERLKKTAEKYPAYTLNYIKWRDSVIMTDGTPEQEADIAHRSRRRHTHPFRSSNGNLRAARDGSGRYARRSD